MDRGDTAPLESSSPSSDNSDDNNKVYLKTQKMFCENNMSKGKGIRGTGRRRSLWIREIRHL
jgi:hypothetical protein